MTWIRYTELQKHFLLKRLRGPENVVSSNFRSWSQDDTCKSNLKKLFCNEKQWIGRSPVKCIYFKSKSIFFFL